MGQFSCLRLYSHYRQYRGWLHLPSGFLMWAVKNWAYMLLVSYLPGPWNMIYVFKKTLWVMKLNSKDRLTSEAVYSDGAVSSDLFSSVFQGRAYWWVYFCHTLLMQPKVSRIPSPHTSLLVSLGMYFSNIWWDLEHLSHTHHTCRVFPQYGFSGDECESDWMLFHIPHKHLFFHQSESSGD